MSLYTTVLARQSLQLFGKGVFQPHLRLAALPAAKWVMTTSCIQSKVLKENEDFWDKNKRLKRPISPHLTIYKPQITWILSITHRLSGVFLSSIMSGFAIGMYNLPEGYLFYLGFLESCQFGEVFLFLIRFGLAWPFVFHISNGIRHLAWDYGSGFQNKEVSASGWAVVCFTTILSFLLAF